MHLPLLWIVPALPLAAVLVNLLLGDRLGRRGTGWLACGAVGLAFLAALRAVLQLAALPPAARTLVETCWTWMRVGDFQARVAFLLDPLSAVMVLVVTGVGALIHVYSTGYMAHDPGFRRFFLYLNLFMFAMLTLVLADNYLLMFVGWEGVGLCSYLLIGFWYERPAAAEAGKKAFIVNRIGDFGFMLGVFTLIAWTGSVDFERVFAAAPSVFAAGGLAVTAATLLLFLGATGKSAQIPLYTWLPDAMEGPTPVSALIHAATMVTAGVYMLARSHVLFALAPATLEVVAVIGAATALMAATIGLAQNDIKRVLAYSTVSQLGYMFFACGVGAFGAGIFHLMTHAFFKALLFLGSGSVIHALNGEQDLRRMGGLARKLPWTHATMLVATLAIAGIPPFAGFFSKDEILSAAFASGHFGVWLAGLAGAGLTALYMFRLYVLTFR
ncbi:MAG TPA: NADH-quinone oxidoreductase subunit L, partial [Candidatus Eisenbacteria bacterium]|nr:NADH-quinone oxidoreductase subunit L [Candidatus Eisenbacteria bacterium]